VILNNEREQQLQLSWLAQRNIFSCARCKHDYIQVVSSVTKGFVTISVIDLREVPWEVIRQASQHWLENRGKIANHTPPPLQ